MFKKSFNILKNNLIFVQPLLMYILLVMTLVGFISGRHFPLVPKSILIISFILLFAAFISGWFHINKHGILSYNEEATQEEIAKTSVENIKKFFSGIGENFIKSVIALTIIFIIFTASLWLATKACMHYFGTPNLIYDMQKIVKATSQAEMLNYLNNITQHDKLVFIAWFLIFNTMLTLLNFFSVLFFAVINFEKYNVFISFFKTIEFGIKNVFKCILIMIVTFLIYALINIFSALIGMGTFSLLISILLLTAYLNYYVILVFDFYYDKTKNNSDNRAELIGEDSTCN